MKKSMMVIALFLGLSCFYQSNAMRRQVRRAQPAPSPKQPAPSMSEEEQLKKAMEESLQEERSRQGSEKLEELDLQKALEASKRESLQEGKQPIQPRVQPSIGLQNDPITMNPANFETYFYQKINELKQLNNKPTQSEEDIMEISRLEAELPDLLKKRSKSTWFYDDNLVDYFWELEKIRLPKDKVPIVKQGGIVDVFSIKTTTPVVQLFSHQQIDPTCGVSMLANAYALENLLKNKKPVTADNVRKLAQSFFSLYAKGALKIAQCAIQESGIDPNNIVTFGKEIQPPIMVIPMLSEQLGTDNEKRILSELAKNNVAYIMIYVGGATGHYTLASIVDEGNNRYKIYYLDSMNRQIDSKEGRRLQVLDQLIQSMQKKSVQPTITTQITHTTPLQPIVATTQLQSFVQKIDQIITSHYFKSLNDELQQKMGKALDFAKKYYAAKDTENVIRILKTLKGAALHESIPTSVRNQMIADLTFAQIEMYKGFIDEFNKDSTTKLMTIQSYIKAYNNLVFNFNKDNLDKLIDTVSIIMKRVEGHAKQGEHINKSRFDALAKIKTLLESAKNDLQ